MTGRKKAFNLDSSQSILEIKEQLQATEGIDVKQIRLINAGKQLVDSDIIEASTIEPGGTIHMVLAIRGGMRV